MSATSARLRDSPLVVPEDQGVPARVRHRANRAPGNPVVWSPDYGGGYPYPGGRYNTEPGTADFAALDTNRDGALTMSDDVYAPFYPGDAYVDWVGLSDS